MKQHLLFTLVMAALLAGCKVGPNYKPPKLEVEKSYGPLPETAPAEHAVTTAPAATAQWWKLLNDPELDALIGKAVAANHDIRLATARLREARARRGIAVSAELPNANLDASYSDARLSKNAAPYNAFNAPGFPWEFATYQAGFDASWEIDIFGGARRGVEAADADVAAGVEDARAVMVSVLAEVARNYVELRGLQRQFDISSKNLDIQRQTLDLTSDRARAGTATELDVSRAAAQVASTEAILPRLRSMQWHAMHRLAVLTGQQPGALVEELAAPKPVPTPPMEIPVGAPADLLRRRPDIRRSERELAAATARIGVAAADLYPKLSLTGVFNFQSEDTKNLFNRASRSFSLGPSVQWPIFDAGRLRAVVRARNAQQEQALVKYEQTVLRAFEEVHNALTSFVTEQDRRKSLMQAAEQTRLAASLAQDLYKNGVTDFITVLDAERQQQQAESALVDNETSLTTSLIAIYKALGGGWETETSPAKNAGGPASTPVATTKTEK